MLLQIDGNRCANLPIYRPGSVPAGVASAEQLLSEGLHPKDEGKPDGWLIDELQGGGYLHTAFYRRDIAVQLAVRDAAARDDELFHAYGFDEAYAWTWDVVNYPYARIVGITTAACCGRIMHLAIMNMRGEIRFDQRFGTDESSSCTNCADVTGPRFTDAYEQIRRFLHPRRAALMIGWGLADAMVLAAACRSAHERQQQNTEVGLSLEFEDLQRWDAEGRGAAGWSQGRMQYCDLPTEADATERCRLMYDRIAKLHVPRRGAYEPILLDEVGPKANYGVITLPQPLVHKPRGATRTRAVAPEAIRVLSTRRAGKPVMRREAALSLAFERRLRLEGHEVMRYRIDIGGADETLWSDLVDVTAGVLYEAKAKVDRATIRMAIGQLADYGRNIDLPGLRRAVLLPKRPSLDLRDLLASCAVGLVYWDGEEFSGDFKSLLSCVDR